MPTHTPPASPGENTPERREFFRIEDRIGLEVRKLGPDVAAEANHFNGDHLESLKAELRRLDQDVRSQLASLAERDRLVANLIKSLNGKLDTLARIMAFEQNPLQPEDWQMVTLSEGGLAFCSDADGWQVGDRMAVRMTLPPELYQPEGVARILDIQPEPAGEARIHTAFIELPDSDRQLIARHVMRWQIRQRQKE